MSTSRPGPISAGAWARLALLGGVLFGVVAMHGLAGHGVGSACGSIPGPMAHAAMSITGEMVQRSSPTTVLHSYPPGMPGGGMVGWCIALVGTALGLVLLQGNRRGQSRAARQPSRDALVAVSARRDRDPPCLVRLSIQRC